MKIELSRKSKQRAQLEQKLSTIIQTHINQSGDLNHVLDRFQSFELAIITSSSKFSSSILFSWTCSGLFQNFCLCAARTTYGSFL
jgi:hypothetical protein